MVSSPTFNRWNVLAMMAVLLASRIDLTSAVDGFLLTMPRTLHDGDQSEFCVTVYGKEGGTKAITMSMINRFDHENRLVIPHVYNNSEQECIKFTVPEAGKYEVTLYNDTTILHDTVDVTVKPRNMITIVQTDKPLYKPGQTVKFRILTFKSNQKPKIGAIESIYVTNPSDSRVKQFLNVDTKGIASLEFELSKEAQLGKWKIHVFLKEGISSSPDGIAKFEVKEYVLPRFEVKIKYPTFILAKDDVVDMEVCASYTYGKQVEGYLNVNVCWFTPYFQRYDNACFHQVVEFSGCYKFPLNRSSIEGPRYLPFGGLKLKTTASVTERGSGAVVNATLVGPTISSEPLKIALEDFTNGFFKPRLPYYGKAIVTKPDGTPASDINVKIIASDYLNDLKFSAKYITDKSGTFIYSLCGAFGEETAQINIDAIAYEFEDYQGGDHRGMYTPRQHKEIRQWFSPSLSYIEIPRTETVHKCGDELSLSIPFTTRSKTNRDFKYQVMARGKIITKGSISYDYNTTDHKDGKNDSASIQCLKTIPKVTDLPPPPSDIPIPGGEMEVPTPPAGEMEVPPPPAGEMEVPPPPPLFVDEIGLFGMPENHNDAIEEPVIRSMVLSDTVSSFNLRIPITTLMAPKFTLLIYHTLADGEIVADSMEYNVEPCFDNNVEMSFDKSKVSPGEDVNIRLDASPGSICGLGIVDKSINILGGKSHVTADTIFQALEEQPGYDSFYTEDTAYCEDRIRKLIIDSSMEDEQGFWKYSSPYVDAMQAFRSSGFLTITDLDLETRPCNRDHPVFHSMFDNPMPLEGLNGPVAVPLGMPGPGGSKVTKSPEVKVRSLFPETWLWDLQIVGENGSEEFTHTAPDTITSWLGNAVCMNGEDGIGVSKVTSLTTFKPFFVHIQLPYSAVRGERLPLTINTFNYVENCLLVKVDVEADSAIQVHNQFVIHKPLCVCGGKSVTRKLWVTPEDIGRLPLTVKAQIISGSCEQNAVMDDYHLGMSDAVKRNLFVKPEGVMKEYTHTEYICPKGGKTEVENLILPIEVDFVKDSERGEVKVIGDIMGPALKNLDNLVRMPTGCGEQNMVGFVPNIFVLKYLKSTGRLTKEIENKCKNHMEVGYQRELKYRHEDGSYSAFGGRDKAGSVWLTAFVVKSYAQARPYIYINDRDMEISLTFLRRSQLENGCWRETGKVFSSYMMGGLGRRKSPFTTMTAYVLIALLKAEVNTTERVITAGFNCLNREFRREKNKMDSYSLSLVAYASTLHDPESRLSRDAVSKLHQKSKRKGSMKYWTRSKSIPQPPTYASYHSASSAEVEMTAYAMLATMSFHREDAISRTHGIAMWLSQQRNPRGGFSSTQDTVIGLNALSEFALMTYTEDPTELNVTVDGNDYSGVFQVSEQDNTILLLQSMRIPTIPNIISIKAQGTGCALVQANVRFNAESQALKPKKPGMFLKISPRHYRHDINKCDKKTLQISVGTRSHHRHSKGMSMLTVKMVTGWSPIKESLIEILSKSVSNGVKRYEYDEEKGVVAFYLDELKKKLVHLYLDVEQDKDLAVSSPKNADVEVYQYYETDVSFVRSYNLKTICGTKEEIPRTRIEVPEGQIMQVRIGGPPALPILPTMPALPALPVVINEGCPICVKSVEEKTLKELLCNSAAVYKSAAGRKKKYPIKLRVNIKADKKTGKVNKFVKYTLPEGCDCSYLKPPRGQVFIFTSNEVSKKHLPIDAKSAIIKSSRTVTKQIKKLKKTCK